jgi:hypothetical protein
MLAKELGRRLTELASISIGIAWPAGVPGGVLSKLDPDEPAGLSTGAPETICSATRAIIKAFILLCIDDKECCSILENQKELNY